MLVFIASSLVHMVFKWHNSDYRKVANEDEVMAALRAGSPTPGQYVFPHCMDMKQMQDDAMKKKYEQGPVGKITLLRPGMPNMGKPWGIVAKDLLDSPIYATVCALTFMWLWPNVA